MTGTQDIVQKLWNLCHVLRDDGITYHQYVTELTYLLFLKMARETEREGQLPEGHRWRDLETRDGLEQLQFYRAMLVHLGAHGSERVQAIYANASTALRQPRNLKKLVESIDELDWYSARHEGLGDLYEGLLEKNATEQKSGAGQYFTPRPLIECMVACVQPRPGEVVQDPAAGTGGFLINADRSIKARTDELFALPVKEQDFQREEAFWAMELVPDAHRLLLMNALLHGIDNLDVTWLRDESAGRHEELPEPEEIAAEITAKLQEALEGVPALLEQLRRSILASAFHGDLTADWRARNPDVEPASVLLERIRAEYGQHRAPRGRRTQLEVSTME